MIIHAEMCKADSYHFFLQHWWQSKYFSICYINFYTLIYQRTADIVKKKEREINKLYNAFWKEIFNTKHRILFKIAIIRLLITICLIFVDRRFVRDRWSSSAINTIINDTLRLSVIRLRGLSVYWMTASLDAHVGTTPAYSDNNDAVFREWLEDKREDILRAGKRRSCRPGGATEIARIYIDVIVINYSYQKPGAS